MAPPRKAFIAGLGKGVPEFEQAGGEEVAEPWLSLGLRRSISRQWARAGSVSSARMGVLAQQMIDVRPGYQFNVMVTENLVFPAPYQN